MSLLLPIFIFLIIAKLTKLPCRFLVLFLSFSFVLSLTMIKSGTINRYGLCFWGPNGHDGIWHLAVIRQINQHFPPQHPVFSNHALNNYHWGFDALAALLTRTGLNYLDIYFRFLPLLFALLLALLSYLIAQAAQTPPLIFVILNFFASSLGWLVTLFKSGQLGGESLFWSMQSASTLLNPPYALSLVILLLGLFLWLKHQSALTPLSAFSLGLLFSLLTITKIYAAVLVGASLFFILLAKIYQKQAQLSDYILTFTMASASLTIILAFGLLGQTNPLQLKPLWFSRSLIESIDKLYLPRLAALRSNLAANFFTIKLPLLVLIEVFLLLLFLIGNLGGRLLALIPLYRQYRQKQFQPIDSFLLPLIVIGALIPFLFVQKGTAWNTIQFFYYSLFGLNFYTARFLARIKNHFLQFGLICLICFGSLATFKDYLGFPPPAAVPPRELKALNFLEALPPGTVLTYPYEPSQKQGLSTPLPLYLYQTTAYVSALTGKTTFLADEMNLNITQFNWQERKKLVSDFFHGNLDKFAAKGMLRNHQIDYVYLVNNQKLAYSPADLQLDQIFQHQDIRIYQIQK